VRTWSFRKQEKARNTSQHRANAFGFYTINGNGIIRFYHNSRTKEVCSFLEAIISNNPERDSPDPRQFCITSFENNEETSSVTPYPIGVSSAILVRPQSNRIPVENGQA
jgi:hypothetical protein